MASNKENKCFIRWHDTEVLQDVHLVQFPQALPWEPKTLVDRDIKLNVSNIFKSSKGANTVLVTAWALVLAKYTDLDSLSFAVGLPSNDCLKYYSLDFDYDAASGKANSDLLENVEELTSSFPSSNHNYYSFNDRSKIKNRNILLLPAELPKGRLENSSDSESSLELPKDCPLIVDCSSAAENGEIIIRFDSKILPPKLADHLLKHICKTIKVVQDDPNMIIRDLDCFEDSDFETIKQWVPPAASPDPDRMLYSGFEERAQVLPKAIAIRQTEMVMTYAELESLASVLAQTLVKNEASRGDKIGIMFEKSAYVIVSMLGIWKTRGAYVPMDPAVPDLRLKSIVKDAGIKIILCSADQHDRLLDLKLECSIVRVDARSLWKAKKAQKAQKALKSSQLVQEKPPQSSDTAVVIYTSGSTGTPKGVALSHCALTTSIQAFNRKLPIDENTRTFQYAAFTFDISIADIWMTLGQGGCVCLPTEDERFDILNFIRDQHCTYTCLTTSVASTIPSSFLRENHLKALLQCGEPVSKALIERYTEQNLFFASSYGPAEASVYCTLVEPSHSSDNPLDIGQSISGSVVIVDPNDPHRLAPVGCIGELAIFGPSLASGYLNASEKTAEVFRSDLKWMSHLSHSHKHLDRVYLTGDLVRYTGSGSMIYVGRKGGYIKINGHRIETGEVESHLLKSIHGGSADSDTDESKIRVCVQEYEAKSDHESEDTTAKYLACFFTTQDSSNDSQQSEMINYTALSNKMVESWMKSLGERLPEYMIPKLFVPISTLPMTASGKVDRRRLKDMLAEIDTEDVMSRYGRRGLSSKSEQKIETR